jgi:cell division protein DivIC
VNSRRAIITLFFSLIIVIMLTAGLFFWQTNAEYRRLRLLEQQSERRLVELETKLKEQQIILDRLRNDPAYVERVIRRRLGYAKPDEFIFRFDQ